MTVVHNTLVTSGPFITTVEPHVLTPNGVINANTFTAAYISNGVDTKGFFGIAGLLALQATNASGVAVDGLDEIDITQTGQVLVYGSKTRGLESSEGGNIYNVAGLLQATEHGIRSFSTNRSDHVNVAATGLIRAGSDDGDTDGFSGAIMMSNPNNTSYVTNYGTIVGEANSTNGEATAISNAYTGAGFHGYDDMAAGSMRIYNGGTIEGYVLTQAGGDAVYNAGLINGNVLLGDDVDNFDGRGGTVTGYVSGGNGDDWMIGGYGDDTLLGDAGNDILTGLDNDDHLDGGSGNDTISGSGGADFIQGSEGADLLLGGSGDDNIYGGDDNDYVSGNSGQDVLFGDGGEDTIFGGSGDDDVRGGSNPDEISGNSGNDILRGEGGADSIGGGAGDDTLSGSTGFDSLDGGSGDDRLFGGANEDTLEGTLGNDYLDAGSGDDSLRGGSDNDTLIGGSGTDTLSGGNGADVFVFSDISDSPHGATRDTITDFKPGIDMIDLSGFGGLTFVNSYTGAGNEVRYNDAVGRLYIDIDGDLASDFSVDFTGAPALMESDLIL